MIVKSEKRSEFPPWSQFQLTDNLYDNLSIAQYKYYLENEWIGHLIVCNNFYSKNILEIMYFEVHPEYRSRGIGKQLFESFIADYPNHHIALECLPNFKTYNFYTKLNFVVFHYDGRDNYHLIRLIPGTHLKSFIENFKEEYYDDLYPESDFNWAGTVWSKEEERFIIIGRSEEEELDLIINDPYMIEIKWVSKQTPEIQMIVAKQYLEEALMYIRYPTRELRLYALKQNAELFLNYFAGPCTEEEMILAQSVYNK